MPTSSRRLLLSSLIAAGLGLRLQQVAHADHARHGCCAHCGCDANRCRKVCRLVQEDKKITTICRGMECEDFCVPGPSTPDCKQSELVGWPAPGDKVCSQQKRIVWTSWIPGCGQEIYTSIKNQKPLEITCQEYLRTKPSAEWVNVTQARLDYFNCAVLKSRFDDTITEVFVPLRGTEAKHGDMIQLLVASKKPEMIHLVDSMCRALETAKSPTDLQPDLLAKLTETIDVSGLVRFGINSDSKTLEKLGKLDLPLAKDYVILNDGEQPSAIKGLILFGLGLLLLGYQIRKALRTPTAAPTAPNLPPRDLSNSSIPPQLPPH